MLRFDSNNLCQPTLLDLFISNKNLNQDKLNLNPKDLSRNMNIVFQINQTTVITT